MVEKKLLFSPGQMVIALNGATGMVMDQDMYDRARKGLKEGRKAGRYFAPGCCHRPDYVTQVPVLFEDGTYDVMRPTNIKKKSGISETIGAVIQNIIREKDLAP